MNNLSLLQRFSQKGLIVLVTAFALAWAQCQRANAVPVQFIVEFTQTAGPEVLPRTGHLSIDSSFLNTGLDQFVSFAQLADEAFEITLGDAAFPDELWFGFVHIPPSGLLLHFQGLPTDDPGSNAIAELLLPANDPSCLGIGVAVPAHCELALGGGPLAWTLVLFDSASNLAVAEGTYTVRSIPEPASERLLLSALLALCLTRAPTGTRRHRRQAMRDHISPQSDMRRISPWKRPAVASPVLGTEGPRIRRSTLVHRT